MYSLDVCTEMYTQINVCTGVYCMSEKYKVKLVTFVCMHLYEHLGTCKKVQKCPFGMAYNSNAHNYYCSRILEAKWKRSPPHPSSSAGGMYMYMYRYMSVSICPRETEAHPCSKYATLF